MVYTLGIDVGSTTSKCVLLENGTNVIESVLIQAGTGTKGPAQARQQVLEKAGLTPADLACVIGTGYGRMTLPDIDGEMSELSCHARGVAAGHPKVRTIIDIGGQDAKVIRLDSKGRMSNFVMNDKCAAGTGRFLDVMAGILQMDVGELEKEAAKAENPVKISSTCTVFAESEVISQLANGAAVPDVVAGICNSVAARTAALVKRIGVSGEVFMSGGVARNGGVRRALERELQVKISYSGESQLMGAYGAAIAAYEKRRGKL